MPNSAVVWDDRDVPSDATTRPPIANGAKDRHWFWFPAWREAWNYLVRSPSAWPNAIVLSAISYAARTIALPSAAILACTTWWTIWLSLLTGTAWNDQSCSVFRSAACWLWSSQPDVRTVFPPWQSKGSGQSTSVGWSRGWQARFCLAFRYRRTMPS